MLLALLSIKIIITNYMRICIYYLIFFLQQIYKVFLINLFMYILFYLGKKRFYDNLQKITCTTFLSCKGVHLGKEKISMGKVD